MIGRIMKLSILESLADGENVNDVSYNYYITYSYCSTRVYYYSVAVYYCNQSD